MGGVLRLRTPSDDPVGFAGTLYMGRDILFSLLSVAFGIAKNHCAYRKFQTIREPVVPRLSCDVLWRVFCIYVQKSLSPECCVERSENQNGEIINANILYSGYPGICSVLCYLAGFSDAGSLSLLENARLLALVGHILFQDTPLGKRRKNLQKHIQNTKMEEIPSGQRQHLERYI
jgi:hypothetical protein